MRKKIATILASLMLLSSFNSVYAKSIQELNKEKKEIKEKVNESKQELAETKEEKSALLKEVEKLDEQLNNVTSELEKLENELKITKESLAKTEEELKIAEETKNNQYESLKKRLRIMYEYGSESYLEILIDSKGITDFFKRIEYVNRIMKYDQELFERYEETERIYEAKVEEIKIQKENIEILTEEQNIKKKELEKSIANKEQVVAKLQKEEQFLEQQLKELEKEDKEITKLINSAKVTSTGSSTNKVYPAGAGGRLAHPVPAYAGRPYNDTYRNRINPVTGKAEKHTGLDLKATYGTDIVAAEAGTVIYSGVRGGYGNTVIIDHGGGMTTLYAHNSSLTVKKGQTVQRGQVIAKAGSTGISTGVHAHFEVRINGQHTDPAPYLQ
ncbi:MAG: peptidoglycan DD-metalloendopeptidase family protein [Eubacteriales bacterium]|nr:peptidoglycan DD-metalloendopeptidase family protein [Eubacteriales bacterium]